MEDDINKILRITFYVGIVVGFFGITMFAQMLFTGKLQAGQITPQPQRFTQLYFTNYRQLPSDVKIGTQQKLHFTVHNLEHQTIAYTYELIAVAMGGGKTMKLGDGQFTLVHDQSKEIERIITVPPLDARVKVEVKITYQGITHGQTTTSLQTQTIHHWITFLNFQSEQKGAL